jgi:hypothetical protein
MSDAMTERQLSTSPAVVFDVPDNQIIEGDNGEKLCRNPCQDERRAKRQATTAEERRDMGQHERGCQTPLGRP